MFSTTCFTAEKMTFMIQVVPAILIIISIIIFGSRLKKVADKPKTPPEGDKPKNALSAATAVVKKNKGAVGLVSILTILYAGFLSFKKNKGITLNGALASLFSPRLYIVMMLSTAKKFSLNHLLGKGEWKKCVSTGLPWWYWVILTITVLPFMLIGLFV